MIMGDQRGREDRDEDHSRRGGDRTRREYHLRRERMCRRRREGCPRKGAHSGKEAGHSQPGEGEGDLLIEGRIWLGRREDNTLRGKGELAHECRRGFWVRETEETFRWHSMREEKVTRREKRLGEQGNVKQARKCAEERPFVEGKNNVDEIEVHSQRRGGGGERR